MKTIIFAEPHDGMRLVMNEALKSISSGEIVELKNAHDLKNAVIDHPDFSLIILSCDEPGSPALKVAQEIKTLMPEAKVLITSAIADESTAVSQLGLGGFIPKEAFFQKSELENYINL